MPPTEAGAMLREAAELVDGPRESDHGPKQASFDAIARTWSCYLENKQAGPTEEILPITAVDVAQMMVLLKMTRPQFGEQKRDHFLDQCGYSGIAGMLAGELDPPVFQCSGTIDHSAKPGGVTYYEDIGKGEALSGTTFEERR